MRFLPNGPNIPDRLLEQSDEGRVVFLCGAGVSLPSGLPSFVALTKYVIYKLDPDRSSSTLNAFCPWLQENNQGPKTPLDQIYNRLYDEYGKEEVNQLVAKRLKRINLGKNVGREHSVVARLSAGSDGRPQIVTTNFDRLFEKPCIAQGASIFEPPSFPTIEHGEPVAGLTYLHGRLKDEGEGVHDYVLSSADLGKAYLAQGWATHFVRALLDKYTVVLLGYQAEDPPVSYLLQGLKNDDGYDHSRLYALDKGAPEQIEAKWRDRGVTPIASPTYQDLWDTLEKWAERRESPRKWRQRTAELAKRDPKTLQSYQRGQVCHLFGTTQGAKLLTKTPKDTNIEWLCVLDGRCRSAKPYKSALGEKKAFDPQSSYGIDTDPVRATESDELDYREFENFLEWRKGDAIPTDNLKLNGLRVSFASLPARLGRMLVKWITAHLDNPIAAWWAAKQDQLHPILVSEIERQLFRHTALPLAACKFWNAIIELQRQKQTRSGRDPWYDLQFRCKTEGWTEGTIREFDRATTPFWDISSPTGLHASQPPAGEWCEEIITKIASIDVKLNSHHLTDLDVPEANLFPAVIVLAKNLTLAEGMRSEFGCFLSHSLTCYMDRENDDRDSQNGLEDNFLLFCRLFTRLSKSNPNAAKGLALSWSAFKRSFFNLLLLFAYNYKELFPADEAFTFVVKLEPEIFWDEESRRELLFLLQDRWEEFNQLQKEQLFEKLFIGPEKQDHETDESYQRYKLYQCAFYIKWLSLKGCDLPTQYQQKLDSLIANFPDWNDAWTRNLIAHQDGSHGWVKINEAPQDLVDTAVDQIITRANELSQRDVITATRADPFAGLVKEHPKKALDALLLEANKAHYPVSYWQSFIHNWPVSMSDELFGKLVQSILAMPHAQIKEFRYLLSQWLKRHFVLIYQSDADLALRLFDHISAGIVSDQASEALNPPVKYQIFSRSQQQSSRSIFMADTSPVGLTCKCLLDIIKLKNLDKKQGFPVEIKCRLDILMAFHAEPLDHVIAVLTKDLSWLHFRDPIWVEDNLIPLFDFEKPLSEPAWSGFLSTWSKQSADVFKLLKLSVLKLFPEIYKFGWSNVQINQAACFVIWLATLAGSATDGITFKQARKSLRAMTVKSQCDVIHYLGTVGQELKGENGWKEVIIPFISKAWPLEKRFRTTEATKTWFIMLTHTQDNFPAVLHAVQKFLTPVQEGLHDLYYFSRELNDSGILTEKYPEEVLSLLSSIIPIYTDSVPYELSSILELIIETEPELSKDNRYLRLMDLVERQ